MTFLTKSKYMNGLQCHRLLYFANKKELPKITLSDQHKFNQGAEFEKYAHKLFENVIDLSNLDFLDNLKQSKQFLNQNKTLFESGFSIDDLYVRVDVLEPIDNKFNLYEIKSTTQTKPEHINDLAFQKYVLEKINIKINNCYIIHLNKEFNKNGKINPRDLCQIDDVTDDVLKIEIESIKNNVSKFKEIIGSKEVPPILISKNCNNPYECPLKEKCWSILPKNNVLLLTNWRVYWKLFNENILDLKDIPEDEKLTSKDKIILNSHLNNKSYVSKEQVENFLSDLNYPLYHFDFETFQTAVPIFDNSKPWQQIPFQYSLHIEKENGEIEHREFLSDSNDDPRPKLLKQLKNNLGEKGDIVVFNKAFEIFRLKEMANDFPIYSNWIQSIIPRIKDLALPFQNFYYYNPMQKGSYSIKKVLPALTDIDYSKLDINNGGDASVQFFYSHIKHDLEGKEKIRIDLLKYCELDTKAMIIIINQIKKLI
jgi:hypothetical protein